MKKLLIIFIFTISNAVFCDVVRIPKSVTEIKYAEYSSGGGSKSIVYVKVFCIDDGKPVLYMDTKVSRLGLIGIGRFNIPKKIEFIRDSSLKDKIVFER